MSAYTLVLGDAYVLFAIAGAIAGVLSALLFTEGGLGGGKSDLTSLQVHATKAVVLTIFLFFVWREADDLMDTLVKASFPLGVYKIAKTFVSALLVWRASSSTVVQHSGVIRNG